MLGAALERAGTPALLVGRPGTGAAIAAGGVRVRSALLGDIDARPATAEALGEPVDVLFVAAKATGLEDALARVDAEARLVIPLLNGIDHVALLRERFGPAAVAAATVRVGVHRDGGDPTRLTHVTPFWRLELAHDDPARRSALEAAAGLLRSAGAEASLGRSEAQTMWSKLVRLNALASATGASGLAVGGLRADAAWWAALEACVAEGAAVAGASGASIDADRVRAEFGELPDEQRTSMQEDLALGRTPELDAIQGAVLRAGARHHVATPTIARLAGTIADRAGIRPPVT